jgi:hypothetical protein
MRLEKGLKCHNKFCSPRECGLATFSNDIVNAVKIVFGDTLPLRYVHYMKRRNEKTYKDNHTTFNHKHPN